MFSDSRPFRLIHKLSQEHFFSFLLLSLLIITLFLAVHLVQQPTKLEKKAAEITIEDFRLYMPTKAYIPYLPVGQAETIDANEAPSQWDNSIELTNFAPQEANFTIKFYNQQGIHVNTHSGILLPNGTHSSPPIKPPGCESAVGCSYSAIIETNLASGSVVNLLRSNGYQFSVSNYKTISFHELKREHFLPVILRRTNPQPWEGDFSETFIVLFNPTEYTTTVSVEFYDMNNNQRALSVEDELKAGETKIYSTLATNLPQWFLGYALLRTYQPTALIVNLQSEKRLFSYSSPEIGRSIFLPYSFDRFFGKGWTSTKDVYVFNTSDNEAAVTEYVYGTNGGQISKHEYIIKPKSARKGGSFASVIKSTEPIAVAAVRDTNVYFGSAFTGQKGYDLIALPYLSHYYPGDPFKTRSRFYLFNPHDSGVSVTFASYNLLGQFSKGYTFTLAPYQTIDIFPFIDDLQTRGSALIKASNKIVALAEGLREIVDSPGALLSGDAFFTYEGHSLLGLVPSPSPSPICKTGVNSFSVYDECDEGRFRYAKFECYDGYSGTLGGPTSCKTSGTWRKYVEEECEGRSNCPSPPPFTPLPTATPAPTPSPSPWPTQIPVPSPPSSPYPTISPIPSPPPSPISTPIPSPSPPPSNILIIRTRGQPALLVWPILRVRVNGQYLGESYRVNWQEYRNLEITIPGLKSTDQIDVVFTNDLYYRRLRQDRNLYIDYIIIAGRKIEAEMGGVVYDLGKRKNAFDGKKTMFGQEAMNWDGALRFNL